MLDPNSVNGDILKFAGKAQDAVESANEDKAAIRQLLNATEEVKQPKCRWWQRKCSNP